MREKFDFNKFSENTKPITEHTISEAMGNNASLLGYYGIQSNLWKATVDNLKLQIENKEAELTVDIKSGSDKVTDATVKAKVANHSDIQLLKRQLLAAAEQLSLCNTGVTAMDMRGKMLMVHGAWLRSEMELTTATAPVRTIGKTTLSNEEKEDILRRAMGK